MRPLRFAGSTCFVRPRLARSRLARSRLAASIFAVAVFAVALLAAPPSHAQNTTKEDAAKTDTTKTGSIRIGFINTFSGQFADAATQMDNGVKLRSFKDAGGEIVGHFRRVEKSPEGLVNVEFDNVENVKDPVKARMSQ